MNKILRSCAVHLAVILICTVTLIPLWWMFVASVSAPGEALRESATWYPRTWTWEHYRNLFQTADMARYFQNSFLVATSVTVCSLIVNGMAGYAFAKLKFRGRDRLFRGLLLTMLIPMQVTMVPLFLLLRQMGLINTYWGVILPGIASVFGIFLVRQYALSIPDSLLDAARIDGSGEIRLFFGIALPSLRPILVALGVFTFLNAWNDFMWPLIALTDNRLYTLPVALANLSGQYVRDVEMMMAGAVVTVLPVLILFLICQRQLMGGIVAGSLKE
jgi:multiple sugar transport system permease protein